MADAAMTVLKWRVEDRLQLPVGAIIRHFAYQDGHPTLWVETDAYPAGREWRSFGIFGTGQVVPAGAAWVGTAFQGSFVWHLYELTGL